LAEGRGLGGGSTALALTIDIATVAHPDDGDHARAAVHDEDDAIVADTQAAGATRAPDEGHDIRMVVRRFAEGQQSSHDELLVRPRRLGVIARLCEPGRQAGLQGPP
jgi:hypothetical protein